MDNGGNCLAFSKLAIYSKRGSLPMYKDIEGIYLAWIQVVIV